MPVTQTRGEAGAGVVAHLQCPHCGSFSKSHSHMLSHLAASHPAHLDATAMGRLGKILMYQSGVRLFHCAICFFNCRDFTKLYKHIITKHCTDRGEEEGGKGGGDGGEEEEGAKEGLKRQKSEEGGSEKGEEEEGNKDALSIKRSSEGEEGGSEKGEEEEGKKDTLKRKRSDEGEEEEEVTEDALKKQRSNEGGSEKGEEEEGKTDELKRQKSSGGEDEEGEAPAPATIKQEDEGEKSELTEVSGFRCLICSWSHRQKSVAISHMVRKHNIPKAYANQGIKRDAAADGQVQGGGAEDDEGAGLSEEMLKEEIKATSKVIRFTSSRFVCLVCGWKTKLKGFAISHVLRSHEVERPYACKECGRSFFLPSRLQKHVRQAHRPGRYACPFCWFRSEFLGGFKRHCSRCNARGEGEEEGGGEVRGAGGEEEDNQEEEEEEKKETRAARRRSSSGKEVEEQGEEDDEEY
ncbi:Chromosome alignment-maintaining phosphoprotein 1 [Oryzias melastigma]|uniref:Chromosome alignment-maintaining phosphoprotein 1 n=1 Tax=Oryzias melastigma TaxID=30732 RepID=A0A834KVD9_ORYME|nr:cilia- and flagella-associated protein 251 [Oryzias melastigma]XP_024144917.1 cilia- and flagella-associated protein 251 [Oryzias melastigma]KAF6734902.1 Chromosome alignment-maintaining phosphoprotein 1 [Oryzias melastigma]